jgi:hypothetical protein
VILLLEYTIKSLTISLPLKKHRLEKPASPGGSVCSTRGKLEKVITTFDGLLNAVKDGALKQEFEKHGESDRLVINTSVKLMK